MRDDVVLANLSANASVQLRRVDHSYRVFTSERRVRFHEMQYFVPRSAAREAVARVRAVIERGEHGVVMPIEVRFTAADDIPSA